MYRHRFHSSLKTYCGVDQGMQRLPSQYQSSIIHQVTECKKTPPNPLPHWEWFQIESLLKITRVKQT